jgi:hypothetical protein
MILKKTKQEAIVYPQKKIFLSAGLKKEPPVKTAGVVHFKSIAHEKL